MKYNSTGNLIAWGGLDYQEEHLQATYEYTDLPNMIGQELTQWRTVYFALRGDFLGR